MPRRQGEFLYPGFGLVFLWEVGLIGAEKTGEAYWVSRERTVGELGGRNGYFVRVLRAGGAACICLWSHYAPMPVKNAARGMLKTAKPSQDSQPLAASHNPCPIDPDPPQSLGPC